MKIVIEVLANWFLAFICFFIVARLSIFFFGKEYAATILVFTFIAVLIVNQKISNAKIESEDGEENS